MDWQPWGSESGLLAEHAGSLTRLLHVMYGVSMDDETDVAGAAGREEQAGCVVGDDAVAVTCVCDMNCSALVTRIEFVFDVQ